MLSRYRIVEKLGAGGMGVVYRAEDLTLRRPVALKFLSGSPLSQEQTRARFIREAQTAAALNHPNVCTIYEVGECQKGQEELLGGDMPLHAGTPFIAMELIEGQTLAAILGERGSIPLDDLLDIAVPIAEGIAAAHARAIVHRDLKPGNVMVNAGGQVKILDFGLAKPLAPTEEGDAAGFAAATALEDLTRAGVVMGTAGYMSPEQAKGEPVDTRSDVFSFGVMLHELATGTRPFRGTSMLSTLAKIIEAEPEPIPETRDDIPQELRRIVRRCLQKNPEDRYNDTRDLVAALKALRQESTSGASKMASPAGEAAISSVRRKRIWAAAAAAALVVGVAVVFLFGTWSGRRPKAAPPMHRQITYTGKAADPVVSPDGQSIAYVETGGSSEMQLIVQDLAGGRPLTILSSPEIESPRWSPDGTALLVATSAGGCVVPRLGGTPQRFPPWGLAAWSPDGKTIASARTTAREITITDVATRDQRKITIDAPYTFLHGFDWSPTGDLFTLATTDERDRCAIWTIAAVGGQPNRIIETNRLGSPRFSPRGDAIYYVAGHEGSDTTSLWKVRVDPKRGSPSGEPAEVLSGLEVDSDVAISPDGKRMFYARGTKRSNIWLAELNGKAEGGAKITQLTSGTSFDFAPTFSPDGRSVTFVRGKNLFVLRVDGGAAEPLTFGDVSHRSPVWSPDGGEIAFIAQQLGTPRVWRISAGGGVARPFTRTLANEELAWSPGSKILYQKPGNRDFSLLDPSTEQETPLLKDDSAGWIFHPKFSPDGTRVAVEWNRVGYGGRKTRTSRRSWVVSLDGSVEQPLADDSRFMTCPLGWSPDGAWVYLVSSEKMSSGGMTFVHPVIVKAPVRGGPAVDVVTLPFEEVSWLGADIATDGRRFVFSVLDTRSDAWLVENFDPEVR